MRRTRRSVSHELVWHTRESVQFPPIGTLAKKRRLVVTQAAELEAGLVRQSVFLGGLQRPGGCHGIPHEEESASSRQHYFSCAAHCRGFFLDSQQHHGHSERRLSLHAVPHESTVAHDAASMCQVPGRTALRPSVVAEVRSCLGVNARGEEAR